MSIKGFLYSIRDETNEIKMLQRQIEELEHTASGIKAVTYDGVKVQTSRSSDPMADCLANLEECKVKLRDHTVKLYDRKQQAIDLINALDDSRERQVLYLYFIGDNKMYMDDVADAIGYSRRETLYIYKRGLSNLSKVCTSLHLSL